MEEIVVIPRSKVMPAKAKPNCLYLRKDGWNDYNFMTMFDLYYCDKVGLSKLIGTIKIMKRGQIEGKLVELPESPFSRLDKNYCSLGQQQSYYEELMALPKGIRADILKSLRDCVYDKKIFKEFKDERAMDVSLMRAVTLHNIENSFHSILLGHPQPSPFHFIYRLNTPEICEIDVKVVPYSYPPTNVHVLIGRNGVGKTRILSGMVDGLTKNKNSKETISLSGNVIFKDEKEGEERFANLITINFSAFDHFLPIDKEYMKGDIRYQYVGLKKMLAKSDKNEYVKSQTDLAKEFIESLDVCLSSQRKHRWVEAVNILNADPILSEYELQNLVNENNGNELILNIFKKLSSGHKVILLSITKLVELVEEKTLVLIDEPETHLHPPLLASFTRALSDLLIKRNGVALIATHSPVVLQEVPKSSVTIIDRVGSKFAAYRPELETFAENVGTLTREVFKLEVADSGFHKMISNYLEDNDYDTLITKFADQIGSEGKAIARSIIVKKNQDNA